MPADRASSGPEADEDALVEVEVLATSVGYSGFFRLDVHRLKHRRFDGGMSEVITREVLERGNAVAVLPYDPRRDEVLLIRQFLPGAYFGGHPPRPLQIIAGMVGDGETEEDVARREAVEEAGCPIGRLERAHPFLPTPGGSSERVAVFCAEADLSAAGGVHGLAEEHEDIRVEVIPADQAIRFLDEGVIEAGPAVVGLAWFARHHGRIRREWLASPTEPSTAGGSNGGTFMPEQGADPSFGAATQTYTAWMAQYFTLDQPGLKRKTAKMQESAFAFLRGTFYRWSHQFAAVSQEVRSAPSFLVVGDIHLENFGTWRDSEGRLVWGINDFDEAAELPFTSDLVRHAASAALEAGRESFQLTANQAADTILEGYWAHLKFGPEPFILEDRHAWLRDLASANGESARKHWRKLLSQEEVDEQAVPGEARALLRSNLPHGAASVRFFRRMAGLGSLGRPRFMAIAEWQGGLAAREIKAALPSAMHVGSSGIADLTGPYRRVIDAARRVPDPGLHLAERWVVRRLSPEARKVEIDEVEHAPDQKHLLHAMGRELANIHVGSAGRARPIRACLEGLPDDWLRRASSLAVERVTEDYEAFLHGL